MTFERKKKKIVLGCKDCWRLWWERLYYFVARRDRTLLIISMTKIKDEGSPPFSRRSTSRDIFKFYFIFLWVKIWWFSLINLCLFVCFDWWCRKVRVTCWFVWQESEAATSTFGPSIYLSSPSNFWVF